MAALSARPMVPQKIALAARRVILCHRKNVAPSITANSTKVSSGDNSNSAFLTVIGTGLDSTA